jgi:hypothetical protein
MWFHDPQCHGLHFQAYRATLWRRCALFVKSLGIPEQHCGFQFDLGGGFMLGRHTFDAWSRVQLNFV